MKLLHWERGGYVMYYKRLEKGRFHPKIFLRSGVGFRSMRWDELVLLTLKLTYFDMKSITRSQKAFGCDSAVMVYQEAVELLDHVEKRPVRLIGVGIHNLSGEDGRQLTIDDVAAGAKERRDEELKKMLLALQKRYRLDFAGHLDQIYQTDTLHKTVEYMRKHI